MILGGIVIVVLAQHVVETHHFYPMKSGMKYVCDWNQLPPSSTTGIIRREARPAPPSLLARHIRLGGSAAGVYS